MADKNIQDFILLLQTTGQNRENQTIKVEKSKNNFCKIHELFEEEGRRL